MCFYAFEKASNDILIILDGDLTVAPESLERFWKKFLQEKLNM